MYVEPEIHELYLEEEPFFRSYFVHLNKYDSLAKEYVELYNALKEMLDEESLDTLNKMLKCQDSMEEFRSLHHFRQGVLLERENRKRPKKKNIILDFPTNH